MPIEEMAALHQQIRQRHVGRFLVFQGIDPRSGRAALDFFERVVVEYRFNGLKLYPPCGYSPSDERLFPFYEVCRDYGLPVLLHTGPTSPVLAFNHAHPSLIDHAALMFPDVNFILAHGGVTHTTEAVQLCAYRPNVFLDFSGFPAALHPQGWAAHLQALFRIGINHKVIFGTDWPLTRMSASTQSYIDQLTRADGPMLGLAAREVEAIMAGNIERLTAESVIRSAAADAPLRRGSAG
jgi:predicted TIM-barrel fold metal-dependent hydrolase